MSLPLFERHMRDSRTLLTELTYHAELRTYVQSGFGIWCGKVTGIKQ